MLWASTLVYGQSYLGVGADLGIFSPSGNWADTYGQSNIAGARIEYGRQKGLYAAIRADILFGNNVKIDPIAALRTDIGSILGDVGDQATFANVSLKSRGWRGAVVAGYRFAIQETGLGFRAAAGPSYTLHYIRIQDDAELVTSNLRIAYKRGYDRRAAGYGGSLEAGLDFINKSGALHAYIIGTADVTQSTSLNSTQFDTLEPTPANGTDTAIGVRIGFVLGIKRGVEGKSDDIYY